VSYPRNYILNVIRDERITGATPSLAPKRQSKTHFRAGSQRFTTIINLIGNVIKHLVRASLEIIDTSL